MAITVVGVVVFIAGFAEFFPLISEITIDLDAYADFFEKNVRVFRLFGNLCG